MDRTDCSTRSNRLPPPLQHPHTNYNPLHSTQAPLLDPLAAPGGSGGDESQQQPLQHGAAPAFCRALVERLGSGGQLRKPKIAKVGETCAV